MPLFKKRTKEDVKSKKAFTFGKKKDGSKAKSGVVVTFNDGDKVTLLTPSGKGTKYAEDLRTGQVHSNDMEIKKDKKDNPRRLSDLQRSYRSGYLAAQRDSAKAYKAKKNN